MLVALFYHSLVSDWNHGNAHFLRGYARELVLRGHRVRIFEPADGWSLQNLVAEQGTRPLDDFRRAFPELRCSRYDVCAFDLDRALSGVDLVIVHEWTDPELVRRIGRRRARGGFRLLFHDTHHRCVSSQHSVAEELEHYDGVLAYGEAIRELYLARGWAERVWTWHEAADTRLFRPLLGRERRGDVVWIGNWGDGERTAELRRFLLGPARALGLTGSIYGVRYPQRVLEQAAASGLTYRGWIANQHVPWAFARHAVTVHIPRRPYVSLLPGVPTIRPFEALACGIPLVCSPWDDSEELFRAGEDYLVARSSAEMRRHLRAILSDEDLAASLVRSGLETIDARHTCAHRVDELLEICAELGVAEEAAVA